MPRKKFGESFKKGAKAWKSAREAEAGSGGWGRYPEGDYVGSTTITVGVYTAGKRKDQDFIAFDTTFTAGEFEGDTVTKELSFGDPKMTEEIYEQRLEKVVKTCKSLFPALADEIAQCGTPEDFLDLLNEEMVGIAVEHEFSVVETEMPDRKTGKLVKIKYQQIGTVLDQTEAPDASDASDDDDDDEPAPRKSRSTKKPKAAEPEDDDDDDDDEADSEDEDEAEDDADEDDEFVPVVGSYVLFKPKGKRKALSCDVKTVNKRKQTCNLEDETGGKHANVPWSEVEPDDE